MTYKHAKSLVTAMVFILPMATLQAQDSDGDQSENHFVVGAGFLDQYAPFNSATSQANLLPIISIKQGAYYFEVAETGFQLKKELGNVTPSANFFVAARSPSGRDRQKLSIDAGARFSLDSTLGVISAEFRHDVTDKFNGSEVIARYSYPISTGRFRITPSVQASWLDEKAANYMYGVTTEQRARMVRKGRRTILPVTAIRDDALNLGGDISMAVQLNDRLTLIAMAGATALDKSIHKSPAIEQKWEAQSLLGLMYRF